MWGSQLSSIGCVPSWRIAERFLDIEGTGEYPGRTWKLIYDRLPRGNKDLGRRGNCKRAAALAKLTMGGEECIRYSYRSETDRRRWKTSWRLSHCDVEEKEKRPHYDLKAATKVMTKPSGTKFSGDKTVPQSDLRAGSAADRIFTKRKKEGKHTNYFVLHVGYFMAVYGNTNIEFSSFLLPVILDCYRFEWGLTKPQQKGQHLACILMHICIPQSPIFLKKTP